MCTQSAHFNALPPIIVHVLVHYNALITGFIMAKELTGHLFADGAWQDA